MTASPLYRIIELWARGIVRAWYDVRLHGEPVPREGPLFVVTNHSNGLVDGVMLMMVARRPLRFLAKYKLFDVPVLGAIVKATGAIPVYRKQDNVDRSKNREAFAAVFQALGDGGAIAVFPEGSSSSSPQLRPLKTGLARMALGAEERANFNCGVKIVPIGMSYERRDRWRTGADARIGPVIECADLRELHEEDPWRAVEVLMDRVTDGLRDAMLALDTFDDRSLLDVAERLTPADGRAAIVRLGDLARGLSWLREHRPDRAQRLLAVCSDLRPHFTTHSDAIQRRAWPLPLWLPAMVVCALPWTPPVMVSLLLARAFRPTTDKFVTTAILASFVACTLWWLALTTLAGSLGGALIALVVGTLLLLSGAASIWLFDRRPPTRTAREGPPEREVELVAKELARLARLARRLGGAAPLGNSGSVISQH